LIGPFDEHRLSEMKTRSQTLAMLLLLWAGAARGSCPPSPLMLKVIRGATLVRLMRLGRRAERRADPLARETTFIGFRAEDAGEISTETRKLVAATFGRPGGYSCQQTDGLEVEPAERIPSQLGLYFESNSGRLSVVLLQPEGHVEMYLSTGSFWQAALSEQGLRAWDKAFAAIVTDRGESPADFYARMGARADTLAAIAKMNEAAEPPDTSKVVDLSSKGEMFLEAPVKVQPEYPQLAREAGVDGKVVLAVLVGADGRVRDVKVVKSIPMLDAAAVYAVWRWRFRPYELRGRPVSAWTRVPVQVSLH
jgi:TonB family protein